MKSIDYHVQLHSSQAAQMHIVNVCCLHLQVVTVADICHPDSIFHDKDMLNGELSLLTSSSSRWWPAQVKLNKSMLVEVESTLLTISARRHSHNSPQFLVHISFALPWVLG